jgi:hypothetical protein
VKLGGDFGRDIGDFMTGQVLADGEHPGKAHAPF